MLHQHNLYLKISRIFELQLTVTETVENKTVGGGWGTAVYFLYLLNFESCDIIQKLFLK